MIRSTHRILRNGRVFAEAYSEQRANDFVAAHSPLYPLCSWEVKPIKRRGSVKPAFNSVVIRSTEIPDRPGAEDNDCTVKALMLAANVDYATAHAMLAEYCRRPDGKGAKTLYWNSFLDILFTRVKLTAGGRTLNKVVPTLDPAKRYIVNINKHALAVVEGKVVDGFLPKALARVEAVWEVRP